MGIGVVLFKSEEKKNLKEAVDFLRLLANKHDEGQVPQRQGEETLTLNIPDQVILEIKAEVELKKRAVKRSPELEIEWNEGDQRAGAVTLE